MDWLLLLGASLALFLARDAALLGAIRTVRARAWTVWAAVQVAVFGALGLAAESISRDHAYALLRDPRFWIPAVVLHLGLWAALFALRRSPGAAKALAVVALAPTPVFVFCAGAAVWLALTRTNLSGPVAGLGVAAAWIAIVLAIARLRRGSDAQGALQFAAASNLSAILLIPIQQQSSDGPGIAEQPIDWTATLVPLGLTASMILLSYLFHRHRSARRAA